MDDNEFLELEHIDGLILAIENHWDFLQGNYPDWSAVPSVMLPPGFMRQLCKDRWADELLRRKQRLNPNFKCPATWVLDSLWSVACEPYKNGSIREGLRLSSARTAHMLAQKSMTEALTKAELNELGWLLTRLVALDAKPIKAALLSLQVKGGVKSGESRRAENADRDRAICDAGRRLISESRAVRNLAGIISDTATAEGLSAKQIRTILRAGGVVPAPSKKGK